MVTEDKLERIAAARKQMRDNFELYGYAAYPILHSGPDPGFAYEYGYRFAAEILTEHVLKERTFPDWLVYPIVFLYRHSVELELKRILVLCEQLGATLPKKIYQSHNLAALWDVARGTVSQKCVSADPAEVDALIAELDKWDKDSQAFRYAETLQGVATHAAMTQFSLVDLKKMMPRLSHSLEFFEMELSEGVDPMADQEIGEDLGVTEGTPPLA